MSEKIKRLKRELKYKGAIVDFYQDTMEIDGTHTATWDFISHKGAAAVVPVTEDGKILMVRQYRNALERYTLEVPARRFLSCAPPCTKDRILTPLRIYKNPIPFGPLSLCPLALSISI